MTYKFLQSGLRWLWISVVVIALDHYTKLLAQQYLVAYDPRPVMPFFNLTLAFNKGAAFSFLSYAGGWQTWLFGILAITVSGILMIWLKKISYKQWWVAVALSMIIGGALGNLWDRINYGHVIDFIDLYVSQWHWPIFNIADAGICIGAFMLIADALFSRKSKT